MGVVEVIWFVFVMGLALWVGGAVTGQVMVARAMIFKDHRMVVSLTREIAWIIPRLYIPAGLCAIFAGCILILLTEVSFLSWWVVLPIIVYAGIVVMGSAYSLPEYRKLNKLFSERGERDSEARRRLHKAAWVNRVELVIVVAALFGIVAGLQPS